MLRPFPSCICVLSLLQAAADASPCHRQAAHFYLQFWMVGEQDGLRIHVYKEEGKGG
jgi:hypothetical protein